MSKPSIVEAPPLFRIVEAWRRGLARREALKAPARQFRELLETRPGAFRRAFPDIDAARAALGDEADPERRGALRAAAAVSLSAEDPDGAASLFDLAGDPDGDRRARDEAFLLYALTSRAYSPAKDALLAEASRRDDPDIRLLAIECRLKIARTFGLGPAELSDLIGLVLAEPQSSPGIRRGAADLLWKLDAIDHVGPLFQRFPEMKQADNPVLARLLTRSPWRPGDIAARWRAAPMAKAVERVERDSAALWKKLAAPGLRVAVVGNSPCETGLGRGPAIDAHDVVVRFNLAPEDGAFAADYGARCDIKVFNVTNVRNAMAETRAPTVAFKSQSQFVANGMSDVEAFWSSGKLVAYIPSASNMQIRRALSATPTVGMLFLGQLRAVRGSLRGVSLYGFSLIDHLTPGVSRHYYAKALNTGPLHNWRGERELLDAWLAEGGD